MGEISQIFQCSFTLFSKKSHEHRFNAVLTAFIKKSGMPTYTSQKFQNKTRFYLYFFNLCVGLLFSKKKNCVPQLKKFKKYCRRLSRKSSHNGVTHYVFLVLYQKRLNGHSVFFYFFCH